MSTMISFADNKLSNNFLSKNELRGRCPMAFKTSPTNPKVSDKYLMATTETVIDDLEKLGWYPVDAKQCRAKANSSGIRSFHMVAFQNPNVYISKPNGDGGETIDSYPRILLQNSHDGFNSFKFMVGCYRLICSNGLVVATNELANMSIRHINYTFEELRKIVSKTIEQIPNIVCTMNTMRKTEIDEVAKKEIAKEVVKIRKNVEDDKDINVDDVTINNILTPVREEDKSNDLWTIFNICQEKLIKGGYMSTGKNNKMRKQRGITSVKKDIDFNQRLWEVAMRYMPQTVAA